MEDKKDIKMNTERKSEGLSRRDFLKVTGLAGLGLALGLRPRRVEAQESPLHLDAIEVADLSPDGGRPRFQRFEAKTQDSSDLLNNPNFSKISQSVQDAVKTATAIFKQKNIQVQGGGITAVVQGVKKEVSGKEPTVTPTAPTGDKDVPVLISVAGSGILVDNDKAWFYGNGEIFQAIGVTQNKDIPANLYVFPRGNTLFAADNKNGGIVYAQGTANDKGTVEWAKVTAPEKSEWDLNSDKAPVLSAGIVEVIRDGKEKAVMIPGTAIAVSMAGATNEFWDLYYEQLKIVTKQRKGKDLDISAIPETNNLVILPNGKTDKEIGNIVTDFVKSLRNKVGSLDYVDTQGNVAPIDPDKTNPQMAVLFFDKMQENDEMLKSFFKERFGTDLTEDKPGVIKKSKAFFQSRLTDVLRVYDSDKNVEYVLVFAFFGDAAQGLLLDHFTFGSIQAANTNNPQKVLASKDAPIDWDATNKTVQKFRFQCGSLKTYGLLVPSFVVNGLYYITDGCSK